MKKIGKIVLFRKFSKKKFQEIVVFSLLCRKDTHVVLEEGLAKDGVIFYHAPFRSFPWFFWLDITKEE